MFTQVNSLKFSKRLFKCIFYFLNKFVLSNAYLMWHITSRLGALVIRLWLEAHHHPYHYVNP